MQVTDGIGFVIQIVTIPHRMLLLPIPVENPIKKCYDAPAVNEANNQVALLNNK